MLYMGVLNGINPLYMLLISKRLRLTKWRVCAKKKVQEANYVKCMQSMIISAAFHRVSIAAEELI